MLSYCGRSVLPPVLNLRVMTALWSVNACGTWAGLQRAVRWIAARAQGAAGTHSHE